MQSLRSRGVVSSPRGPKKLNEFLSSAPKSGGNLKGHHHKVHPGHPWIRSPLAWFFARATLILAAFGALYIFLFVIHNDENSLLNNNDRDDNESLSLSDVSLEKVRTSAAQIHNAEFTELLDKLNGEKEEYRYLLQPKQSLFQKYDKNKPQSAKQDLIKKDKQGNIVYKPITSISIKDLGKLGLKGGAAAAKGVTYEQAIQGREPMMDKIHEAGIEEIDIASILSLPLWSSVTKLYGETPVVIGLERCEEFRTDHIHFPLWDASLGTAGLFNTGTNPFAMYLQQNCKMPENKSDKFGGTRWQVPWGKHALASMRLSNTAGREAKTNKTTVIPIVMVRDPYSWMQSMCKHPYQAHWPHVHQCPHLASLEKPNKRMRSNEMKGKQPLVEPVSVYVKYNPPKTFDSLAHLWAQWYKEYLEADYPRLLVRFEDLQFHAKELIDIICQCAGGVPRNDDAIFRYVVDSAKWGPSHNDRSTNMVTAMIKYGTDKDRFKGMTQEDKYVASSVLTRDMLELFGYEVPDFTDSIKF